MNNGSMSKDIITESSMDKLQSNTIDEKEKHMLEKAEEKRVRLMNRELITYFIPINGVIVDFPIIEDYYGSDDKYLIKSDKMRKDELNDKMLGYHKILSVSKELIKTNNIEVGDYVIKKAGENYNIIRIAGLDYINFELYAIGGFIKKQDYDKFQGNGALRPKEA